MTLGRWDTQPILYAFGNRATPFQRAFWHPGIGLWQFDHPWSNTAAERINTSTAADLAAQVVASRWCSWTSATGFTRFAYTVRPWHGCDEGTTAGARCLRDLQPPLPGEHSEPDRRHPRELSPCRTVSLASEALARRSAS